MAHVNLYEDSLSSLPSGHQRQYRALGYDGGFIELQESDLCLVDHETAKTLELLQNNVDQANRRHSLMGYLTYYSYTTTANRLIKEGIMKPLCHQRTLEHRLKCIDYLVNRVDTLHNISNNIKRFGRIDLDNMVPVLVNLFKSRSNTLSIAEKKLDAIINIESILSEVPLLVNALEGASDDCFDVYKVSLRNIPCEEIIEEIYEIIEPEVENVTKKRSKMFKIKQGVEPLFDIARGTYSAAVSDLDQYVIELKTQDSLPWSLAYTESRGFHLSIKTNRLPKNYKLDPKYIKVEKSHSYLNCTTREMMQSNVRANVSYENSMKLANEVLNNLLSTIINYTDSLNRLVDIVGMLDMITCFTKLVAMSNGGLVKPEFTSSYTVLEKSRHPVLEYVLSVDNVEIVSNDVILRNQRQNLVLVTGPNMGGKSIYLKQVGLIQIMAQLGCYVPSASAHIKIMNRIVARSGTTDDNLSNCSSFMYEMKGIASALDRNELFMSLNTLFLIDEVGRGTSIEDGTSYSFAIAEELSQRSNSFSIFATHFEQVLSLPQLYTNVVPYHFKSEEEIDENGKPKMIISHNIVPGIGEKYHYGIKIAESCDLPNEIIRIAMKDNGL